jgi:hypothetical protein
LLLSQSPGFRLAVDSSLKEFGALQDLVRYYAVTPYRVDQSGKKRTLRSLDEVRCVAVCRTRDRH